MSAPESIRKGRWSLWQKRDKDPEEGTALTEGIMPGEDTTIGPRPGRFPTEDVDAGHAVCQTLGEDGDPLACPTVDEAC